MKNAWIITISFLFFYASTIAQTLPLKQEKSLRAPSNIKLDGKATEWGDKFAAFDKATEVFYTVSNNDENLYFTIKVTQKRVIEKIMNAGITITVNNTGKKDDKATDNVSLTFPLMDYSNIPRIVTAAGAQTKDILVAGPRPTSTVSGVAVQRSGPTTYQPEFNPTPSDSLKDVATKLLNANAKTIKINGIKEIPDGDLSVYNEENIIVGAAFDHTGAYIYELAIPLKYLHGIANPTRFTYNIKLQSRQNVLRRGMVTRYTYVAGQPVSADLDLDSTTDFWGEYTLANKQ
jgi:hypothetical protein